MQQPNNNSTPENPVGRFMVAAGAIWEIPGGAIEFGETLEQGLKREIKEELDVEVEPGKCDRIDWFTLEETEKLPLSLVTQEDIAILRNRNID